MLDLREVRRGRPGGLRLIGLRCAALLLLCLAVSLVARHGLIDALGQDPDIAVSGPTFTRAIAIAHQLGPRVAAAAAVAMVAFVVFDLLLSATALLLLDSMLWPPATLASGSAASRAPVWRTVWDDSWRYLLPFLRLSVVTLVVCALVVALVGWSFSHLQVIAVRGEWRGDIRFMVLVGGRALITATLLHVVAAISRWAKTLLVADGGRQVRKAIPSACLAAWRSPYRTGAYFVCVPLCIQLVGGALLAYHASAASFATAVDGIGHDLLWAVYLMFHSTVWYFLLHRARWMLAESRFDDIRLKAAMGQPMAF